MFVKLNPGWIKLALKFKDFPAQSAIFSDFQGTYEPCIFLNPKNFHSMFFTLLCV